MDPNGKKKGGGAGLFSTPGLFSLAQTTPAECLYQKLISKTPTSPSTFKKIHPPAQPACDFIYLFYFFVHSLIVVLFAFYGGALHDGAPSFKNKSGTS